MRKSFLLGGALLLMTGMSFAAPTPELFADLTNQILVQQTKTQSAKELLAQLKSLFTNCMTSHQDKALQASCTTFLEKHFPKIENQWKEVVTGGLIITPLGKLSNKDRFKLFGLGDINTIHLSAKEMYVPEDFEYAVLNFPEYSFSFLLPFLSEKKSNQKIDANDNSFDCVSLKESMKESIKKLKKEHPERKNQIIDNEETERYLMCHGAFQITRNPSRYTGLSVEALIDTKNNAFSMNIESKMLKKGEVLEDVVGKKQSGGKFTSGEMFFDTTGIAYRRGKEQEYLQFELGTVLSGLVLGYTGDTSDFTKKLVGLGSNLQTLIQQGKVKIFFRGSTIYLQFMNRPSVYYTLHFGRPGLLFGYYLGFDLNNPDGTSPFLSK